MNPLPLLLVGLLACGGGEVAEQPARDERSQADASRPAPTSEPPSSVDTTPVITGGTGPDVTLAWIGIGALHKGFFSSGPQIQQLSTDLTDAVRTAVTVHIEFDSARHLGHIQLILEPGVLHHPVTAGDDWIQLQDLTPVTRALARYRSSIAGRFDIRIESFHVGLVSRHSGVECVFGLGGPPPPDGRVVSPCVAVDGEQRCGAPTVDGVHFDAADREKILACLQ